MSEVKLAAATRTEFGKGAARRVRRDNKVPGVLYGHGTEPLHLTRPGHALLLAAIFGTASMLVLMPLLFQVNTPKPVILAPQPAPATTK